MPSSLAVQLAQTASLNSALLVDRARRKPTQSYLFTGREAEKHDLDSIHALLPADEAKALNGNISAFLPLLGKDLTEMPTGRVLEWFVRRFR